MKKIVLLGTGRPPKVEKTAFCGIFLRKEGLNQKITLHKLVLEFICMANRLVCIVYFLDTSLLSSKNAFFYFWIPSSAQYNNFFSWPKNIYF